MRTIFKKPPSGLPDMYICLYSWIEAACSMNCRPVTVQESFPLHSVPTIFTHVDAFLMHLLDVMRQISLVIGSVVAFFAEVALDLVVNVFNVLLQVAPGSRCIWTVSTRVLPPSL